MRNQYFRVTLYIHHLLRALSDNDSGTALLVGHAKLRGLYTAMTKRDTYSRLVLVYLDPS